MLDSGRISPAAAAALQKKTVIIVGTAHEMIPDPADGIPPTVIAPGVMYLQVPARGAAGADRYTVQSPIMSLQVYLPAHQGNTDSLAPDQWVNSGLTQADIPLDLIYDMLIPCGGFQAALYALPRGNDADRFQAYRVDGLPFYARDTRILYIYDQAQHMYIPVSSASTISTIGLIFIWPENVPTIPSGFLRCDGSLVSRATYSDLFTVIGHLFGTPPNPAQDFYLPTHSNAIIRCAL